MLAVYHASVIAPLDDSQHGAVLRTFLRDSSPKKSRDISLYRVAVVSLFVSVGIFLGTLQLISTKKHTHCRTQEFVKGIRLTWRKIMFCIALNTFHFPGLFQLFGKRKEGRLRFAQTEKVTVQSNPYKPHENN